jgi:hypothetical protein
MKIKLTESQLTKMVKVLKEGHNYTFNDVLDMVGRIKEYFSSFISNLEKQKTTKEHKHPNFPLEHMIKYVLDSIRDNEYEAENMFDNSDFEDNFIYAFFYRDSRSIDSWHNLYCQFKYELERKEPEICKHEDDIDWDVVKKESGIITNEPKKEIKQPKVSINEPKQITFEDTPIYDTFEDAYKFLFELKEVSLDKKFCTKEYYRMFRILYSTGSAKVDQLRIKYKRTKDSPPERSLPSDSDEEKINDFIKKYRYLSTNKFYEFAKMFSDETGISLDKIKKKRSEFIDKKIEKIFTPKYDESSVIKDPDYNKAQEIMRIARKYLNCCRKGYWDCDDDDPPFDFSGPKIYTEPNVEYEPTIKGGNNTPSKPSSGDGGVGKPSSLSETIRKILRKL